LALGSQRAPLRRTAPAVAPRVSGADVRAYLERCAVGIERHRDYLTRLDAVLGDGDHGDNMAIGFQAICELLATYPAETSPGELLRAVGHRLATAVGGASGPLYGTALIEAGLVAGSQPTLEWPLIGRMLDAAAAGLARRGRCRPGDKTILDTLRPAADAWVAADTPDDALRNVLVAGWRGMRSTRPLVARRGLALRLGPRSAGHLDPGAVSCFILLAAIVPSRGRA
jgi:dihydroxyacetone kinase-like protein